MPRTAHCKQALLSAPASSASAAVLLVCNLARYVRTSFVHSTTWQFSALVWHSLHGRQSQGRSRRNIGWTDGQSDGRTAAATSVMRGGAETDGSGSGHKTSDLSFPLSFLPSDNISDRRLNSHLTRLTRMAGQRGRGTDPSRETTTATERGTWRVNSYKRKTSLKHDNITSLVT